MDEWRVCLTFHLWAAPRRPAGHDLHAEQHSSRATEQENHQDMGEMV